MDLKQHFATDAEAEVEGVWHDLGDGARIRVARTGNPEYQQALRRVIGPYRLQMKRGTLSTDRLRALNIEIEAETILLDWEGLEEGGKKIKYSTENAARLLEEYPDFRQVVQELADELTHYRNGAAEEDAEDLGKS